MHFYFTASPIGLSTEVPSEYLILGIVRIAHVEMNELLTVGNSFCFLSS